MSDFGVSAQLVSDWDQSLRAGNVSKGTRDLYKRHVRYLIGWLADNELPTDLTVTGKPDLERYFAELGERKTRRNGREGERVKPAYVASQYRSIQQFYAWLELEGEIDTSPFHKMRPPRVTDQPPPVMSDDAIGKLLGTCKGSKERKFENLRDEAIIRLFADTGARVSGVAGTDLEDFDFETDTVRIGLKGGKTLVIPFGAKTSDALRRYRRARAKEPHADRFTAFFLATRGRGRLKAGGIRLMLNRRAEQAGIGHVHPHLFRHTFAHAWLASGGQEQDLMRLTGWSSREMIGRYGASAADERAREAHRRKALGDRL